MTTGIILAVVVDINTLLWFVAMATVCQLSDIKPVPKSLSPSIRYLAGDTSQIINCVGQY